MEGRPSRPPDRPRRCTRGPRLSRCSPRFATSFVRSGSTAMLDALRRLVRRVLKISDQPPEIPRGEEPDVFRASPKFLTYLLVQWALRTGLLFFALAPGFIGGAIAVYVEHKSAICA